MNLKKRTILILIVAAAITSGCRKNLFDYRNKYCGDWTVSMSVESHTFFGPNGSEIDYYDTIYQSVDIRYLKSNDSLINFSGINGQWLNEVEVLSNGTFKGCSISGSFKGKKEFYLERGNCTYSAGGYQITTFHGTKN